MKEWVKIGLIVGLITSIYSCNKEKCIDGDEYPRGSERSLEYFTEVNADLSAVVELIQDTSSKTPYVELIIEENLETHLSTKVTNEVLNISLGYCFSKHNDIIIKVHYDTLKAITVSGPTDIISKTIMTPDILTLNLNSTGKIDIVTDAKTITANINGTGTILINGQVETLYINHNGSGSLKSYQAMINTVYGNMNGTGNSYVRVQDTLNSTILGAGNIYYKGFPKIFESSTGTGKVIEDN